jgi:alpha-tubulin suppressor-like RCC1 family protein
MEREEDGKKTKDDPFRLLEMINRGKTDITAAFDFMPFTENDVLTVEYTSKSIFMLLKNGTVITWRISNQGGVKKFYDAKNTLRLPQQVKFPVTVVDVVCGREHCLAKGRNNKIYSWGSNSYGQLGLIGFPTNPNSEKGEPSEITALSVRKE